MERSFRMHRTKCRRGLSSAAHLLLMSLWLCAGSAVMAKDVAIAKATTSHAARKDAIGGIPFHRLSQHARARINAVVRKPTMYRRMPLSVIDCDPELQRFLVRYPEVVVNVWQLMGITKITAERIAPYKLGCADGVGTITEVELIYGDRHIHVILCEGSYEGSLFRKPLTGRCVLVLKSRSVATNSGRNQITNCLDVFVQVDHVAINIFAKTLHPLLGRSADVNFLESMKFLQRMSRAAERNGPGMRHLASRLHKVDDDVRANFQQVIVNVNERHTQRLSQARGSRANMAARNPKPNAPPQIVTESKSVPRATKRNRPSTVR